MRVAVRNEPICRIMVGTQHFFRMHRCGMPLGMLNRGRWAEYIEVSCAGETISQIDIFEIHKTALSKATNRLESVPAHESTRSREPTRSSFCVHVFVITVGLGPGVRRPNIRKDRVANTVNNAGNSARRVIN